MALKAKGNIMELIRVTKENLDDEHICCAISNNRDIQVMTKKKWLFDRFDDGLVFLKGNVRGKCFIEYIPAENAWAPIEADGYMYIDCLWVSGQFKGQGYSTLLLDECIKDSREKGKKGIVVISSEKKMGFLSDRKYMQYKGFSVTDKTEPYFELMYLPFEKDAEKPVFRSARPLPENAQNGFTIYYTDQCPFTAKYVPLLEQVARENNAQLHTVHITTKEQAQSAPVPFTTFALFHKGKFITHEILSEKKFEKIISDMNSVSPAL